MLTENKANKLVDDLCKEVYKDNSCCLVLVGGRTDNANELCYVVRGVCVNDFELNQMVEKIKQYQYEHSDFPETVEAKNNVSE